MSTLKSLEHLDPARFDTPAILKKLASSSRQLAELKGLAASIPNQGILINTLGLQEAKDSSEIENIVTTHDELFKGDVHPDAFADPATREVLRYRQALRFGFEQVRTSGLLSVNHMVGIQAELERNNAGFRKLPGTALKDGGGQTVYTPPQDPAEIVALMSGLERFMNDDALFTADPLIKMALVHHQFGSIHPFYDGNGRTGRILNVLYLVKEGLLEIPVLYLSSHIVQTKADDYRLLQTVRDNDTWEEWVLCMLRAVEITARQTVTTVQAIKAALFDYKHRIRGGYGGRWFPRQTESGTPQLLREHGAQQHLADTASGRPLRSSLACAAPAAKIHPSQGALQRRRAFQPPPCVRLEWA